MRSLLAIIVLAFGATTALADPPDESSFRLSEVEALQARPAIAHDPAGDRFLSTWHDYRNRTTTSLDVYGRIVDGRGRPLTADIPVARTAGSHGPGLWPRRPISSRPRRSILRAAGSRRA